MKKFDISLIPPAPDDSFERNLWQLGSYLVAGVDEAGRGALAGPVAAGVVILPPDPDIAARLVGVRDSKQMTPVDRHTWAIQLKNLVKAWGVGYASPEEIDAMGIVPAVHIAIQRALEEVGIMPDHLLVDYLEVPEFGIPYTALVKGDARALSIAAASILAKTGRDAWMCRLDTEYPGYGFASNKGYGTKAHREALARLGISPVHRRSFRCRGIDNTV